MTTGLEICVDTIDCAQLASNAGADRIELCAALSEGGLTPTNGLMEMAAALPVPIYAMIRPRAGGFVYTNAELAVMRRDINAAKIAGMAGVVFGVLNADLTLNMAENADLIALAAPMNCTLHRAFDEVPDPLAVLEQAIDLGFERILTSGQQLAAADGITLITELVIAAEGRISVMPGAGVNPQNAVDIVMATGVSEIHSSCSITVQGSGMFDVEPRKIADAGKIAALLAALK